MIKMMMVIEPHKSGEGRVPRDIHEIVAIVEIAVRHQVHQLTHVRRPNLIVTSYASYIRTVCMHACMYLCMYYVNMRFEQYGTM